MLLSNIEWAAGEMKGKHENFHVRFPDAVIWRQFDSCLRVNYMLVFAH